MKKVFHLLRDNNQLGPFTIDELLQQKLSTDDLIWVEGYSHAWSLPSEIDLLKLSVAETSPSTVANPSSIKDYNIYEEGSNSKTLNPTPKKRRKWADEDIEQRAEEIRKRTLEYVSSKNDLPSPLITDDKIRSFAKTPDIDFVVHNKSKGVSANFVGASLVALMLVAGWYGKDKLFIAQNNSDLLNGKEATPQVIPISSTVQLPSSENESAAYFSVVSNDSIEQIEPVVTELPVESEKPYIPTIKKIDQPVVNTAASDAKNNLVEQSKTEKSQIQSEDEPIKEEKKETATAPLKPDSLKIKTETKTAEAKDETIEKKKSLGQAIKGIFKKKKKDKDAEEEIENDN